MTIDRLALAWKFDADIVYSKELITPTEAARILSAQAQFVDPLGRKVQRRVEQSEVDALARQMAAGLFVLNGDALKFNGDRLLDGQHRLLAVVKAGVPVWFSVARNVPLAAFPTIDTGRVRTTATLLGLEGTAYSIEIAAGARLAMLYERHGSFFAPGANYARTEIVAYVKDAEGAWVDIGRFIKTLKGLPLQVSIAMALSFLVRAKYKTESECFLRDLASGVSLREDQPVRVLRERLLANKVKRAKLATYVLGAFTIKAWNAELSGGSMQVLKFLEGEQYPHLTR
jgi:hypothetical protein